VFGEANSRTLRSAEMLALNETESGHILQAAQRLAKMLELAEANIPKDENLVAELRLNYAEVATDLGKADVAASLLSTVRDFLRQQGGGDQGELAETLSALGYAHMLGGNLDAAESELRESLALLAAMHEEDVAAVLARLSNVLLLRGDIEKALTTGRQARDNASKMSGEKSHTVARAHYCYALALIAAQQSAPAETELRAALQSYALLIPPDGMHFLSSPARLALGKLLATNSATHEESVQLVKQAIALREKNLGADDPATREARTALAALESRR
jgi:tetratricopeptide (TPR) repeat protein